MNEEKSNSSDGKKTRGLNFEHFTVAEIFIVRGFVLTKLVSDVFLMVVHLKWR